VPVIKEELSTRRFIPIKKPMLKPKLFDADKVLNEPTEYSFPLLSTELDLLKAKRVTEFNSGPYWHLKGYEISLESSDNNKYAIALDYFKSGA
jgi:hypothetical protein